MILVWKMMSRCRCRALSLSELPTFILCISLSFSSNKNEYTYINAILLQNGTNNPSSIQLSSSWCIGSTRQAPFSPHFSEPSFSLSVLLSPPPLSSSMKPRYRFSSNTSLMFFFSLISVVPLIVLWQFRQKWLTPFSSKTVSFLEMVFFLL